MSQSTCSCCTSAKSNVTSIEKIGDYVCYCNKVTEMDIIDALKNGAKTVAQIIEMTGAMKDSNCVVNNPKGTCCYPDIEYVFKKYTEQNIQL